MSEAVPFGVVIGVWAAAVVIVAGIHEAVTRVRGQGEQRDELRWNGAIGAYTMRVVTKVVGGDELILWDMWRDGVAIATGRVDDRTDDLNEDLERAKRIVQAVGRVYAVGLAVGGS